MDVLILLWYNNLFHKKLDENSYLDKKKNEQLISNEVNTKDFLKILQFSYVIVKYIQKLSKNIEIHSKPDCNKIGFSYFIIIKIKNNNRQRNMKFVH